MPRKPKLTKHTITVVVNGAPVSVILHPPTGRRSSWFAYWTGLVASKSTGQANLEDAILVAESMVKNGGKQATVATTTPSDPVLTDEDFELIQRTHFNRKQDPKARARATKSLDACLEAIGAFKEISGLSSVSLANPDTCSSFQRKALTLPKNWRHKYPNSQEKVDFLSANTVVKWSGALQASFERANKNAGKKCVRGVVDDSKLLNENPWKQFHWIEGKKKPIRQFEGEELLSLLLYFEKHWAGVTVGGLVAKVCLWSWSRRDEVMKLSWPMLRIVGDERHFEIDGKWGVKKWFRIPECLYRDLLAVRVDNPFVFAIYCQQLRGFFENSPWPGPAKNVEREFNPENLGNWFYKKLVKWSKTLPGGHATTHVFRKTSLQYARLGEDADRQVAEDARLGETVMMTHYVTKSDLLLRQASNRTYQRILASLEPDVARAYGAAASVTDELEKRLERAIEAKDWPLVAKLSEVLASRQRPPVG